MTVEFPKRMVIAAAGLALLAPMPVSAAAPKPARAGVVSSDFVGCRSASDEAEFRRIRASGDKEAEAAFLTTMRSACTPLTAGTAGQIVTSKTGVVCLKPEGAGACLWLPAELVTSR